MRPRRSVWIVAAIPALLLAANVDHGLWTGQSPWRSMWQRGGQMYHAVRNGNAYTLDFAAVRNGDNVEFTDATVRGLLGEKSRPSVNTRHGELFAAFIRSDGHEQKLADLEFR